MNTYAFRMQLKPGVEQEYRRRHDQIWPDLARTLSNAGIYDYSIFLDEETLHLFAVLKLRPNHTRDQLPNQPIMQKWWDYMADLMVTEPNNRPKECPLKPMFHLE